MRIPRSVIDEIYRRAEITEVVADYVPLKKKGGYYVGLSPFKQERTPSFTVTPSKGIFKDFSTGKGGNVVTFLMEVEGYSYNEALLHLAEKYAIEVPQVQSAESAATESKIDSLKILHKFAGEYYHQNLFTPAGSPGYEYLKSRGFTDPTIRQFQLGFALNDWDGFSQKALQNQFSEELLSDSGLCIKSDKTQKLFDRFRGRVMFPIFDVSGKIIAFSGRLTEKKDNEGKYVNSPESLLYTKGKVLFGLNFAKNAIRESEEAVLCEGNADMVSLFQAGIKNAVASSGTALTNEQVNLLARYAKKVLIVFDSDEAGIAAAQKASDKFLERGLSVKVLLLPDGHDPDSYVKEFGGDGFRAFADTNAVDALSFKIDILKRKYDLKDPTQRGFLIGEVGKSLSLIGDPILRTLFIQQCAEKLGISEQLMISAMNQTIHERNQNATGSAPVFEVKHGTEPASGSDEPPLTFPSTPSAEKTALGNMMLFPASYPKELEILRLMLNYPDRSLYDWTEEDLPEDSILMYEYFFQEIGTIPFENPVTEVVRAKLMDTYEQGLPVPIQQLLEEYDPQVIQLITELMTEKYNLSDRWGLKDIAVPVLDRDLYESVRNSLLHFKLDKYNELIRRNAEMLLREQSKPDAPFENIEQLLKRKMRLEASRKQITDELGIVVM